MSVKWFLLGVLIGAIMMVFMNSEIQTMLFKNSEKTLSSKSPAEYISMENLLQNPKIYANMYICTEGMYNTLIWSWYEKKYIGSISSPDYRYNLDIEVLNQSLAKKISGFAERCGMLSAPKMKVCGYFLLINNDIILNVTSAKFLGCYKWTRAIAK